MLNAVHVPAGRRRRPRPQRAAQPLRHRNRRRAGRVQRQGLAHRPDGLRRPPGERVSCSVGPRTTAGRAEPTRSSTAQASPRRARVYAQAQARMTSRLVSSFDAEFRHGPVVCRASSIRVMQETRLFPPPQEFAARARIKSLDEYQQLWDEAAADPPAFWAKLANDELHWFEPFEQGARVERAVRQVVRRRQDQRLVQLPRPHIWRPAAAIARRIHLGRRAGRHAHAHLRRTAPRSLQVRQRAQEAGHRAGRRRLDLHADGAGAGDRHAGLRADRRGSLGDLRAASRPKRSPTATTTPRPSCRSRPTPAGGAASAAAQANGRRGAGQVAHGREVHRARPRRRSQST